MVNTNNSFAFAIYDPGIAGKPVIIHSTNIIKASEFIKLSAKEFSLITGEKMNLWHRLSFSLLKMRMKHDLKNNPNLAISDYYLKSSRHIGTWGWIGIGLGVILIIILIIAAASLSGGWY